MKKSGNLLILILLILVATIIGNIIGDILSDKIPILNIGETIGFSPTVLDLNFISITIGFEASLNLAGVIGIIIAIIIYKKL